jgi:hypothetical protein
MTGVSITYLLSKKIQDMFAALEKTFGPNTIQIFVELASPKDELPQEFPWESTETLVQTYSLESFRNMNTDDWKILFTKNKPVSNIYIFRAENCYEIYYYYMKGDVPPEYAPFIEKANFELRKKSANLEYNIPTVKKMWEVIKKNPEMSIRSILKKHGFLVKPSFEKRARKAVNKVIVV